MLIPLSLLLCFYVLFRAVLPAPVPRWLKVLLVLLTVAGSCKLVFFRLVFGSFSPETPRWIQIGSGIPLGIVMLFAALSLGRDVLHGLVWLSARHRPQVRVWLRSHDRHISLMLALLAVLLAGLAVPVALRVPEVRVLELPVAGLPPQWDGLRLAHVSDLHISPTFPRFWAEETVRRINAARPDMICLTGDLMDGSPEDRADDVAPLADLRAPLGVFACTGNHEYYSGLERWRPVLARLGITLLENDARLLQREGAGLLVMGLTDGAAVVAGCEAPQLDKTLRAARRLADERTPSLLLAHRPDVFDEAAGHVSLQLSGHTHGGMLLGMDRIVAAFNHGYVRGLYGDAISRLHVSSGSGLWGGFPYRLGIPGEVVLLVLRTAPGGGLPTARPLP